MTQQLTLKTIIIFTGIVTVLIWTHLAWDYFHEGVPTHYLLHSQDMPGISNWWGGILLPLQTWFLLNLIQRGLNNDNPSETSKSFTIMVYRFIAALAFGLLLSFLFSIGSDLPGYMMIGVILISFFVPIYRPEYFLGFVLGMAYTFGAMLPMLFGVILSIIGMISYKIVRAGALYLVSKIKQE